MNPRAAAAATSAIVLALAGAPVAAHGAGVFTVHVATPADGGKVGNNGRSAKSPVPTLKAAQDVIRKADPKTDVEVRIRQGTYQAPPKTEWTTYVQGHSISFMPADFTVGENEGGFAGRPVFVNPGRPGKRADGGWLQATTPPGDGQARLKFYYLEVRGYQNGISFNGGTQYGAVEGQTRTGYQKLGKGLNGNSVLGLVFRQIGDRYTGGEKGYGALVLTNSSGNQIRGNRFVNVENAGADGPKIHGAYVTHFSDDNVITGNTFTHVSGDPVKFRDRSNRNRVNANKFSDAGYYSSYREEFCAGACLTKNTDKHLECASEGNRFLDNTVSSGYKGRSVPVFTLEPKGNKVTGPGCPPVSDVRLVTSGNKRG